MSIKTHLAKQPSAPSNNETPSRRPFDFTKIDAAIPVRMLSKTWARDSRDKTFVLGPQPHVAVDHKPHYNCGWPLNWFDAQTGVKGVGAVALVAHVQKIKQEEAARRLVEFLAITTFAPVESFLAADTAEAA